MPPTVRVVAELPELGLRVLTGDPASLARPVRWAATSELADPGPYLEGGELLLSTGMRLDPQDAAAAADYVARLVSAGVAALAFGVGPVHELTPPVLLDAAAHAGLPVLEVPLPVPFIAVSKAVSRLLIEEEHEQTARGFAAQRELIRAALGTTEDGPLETAAAVLPRLVRHVGGFALLLDPAGALAYAQPAAAARRLPELAEEVARLRSRGLLAAAVVASAEEHVALQPLGVHGRILGLLVVGTSSAPGPGDQAVVNLVVSLLSSALAHAQGRSHTDDAVRTAALKLLLAGHVADLPLGELGWTLSGSVRAVVVRPTDPHDPSAAAAAVAGVVPGAAVAGRALVDAPGLVVALVPAAAPVETLRALAEGDDAAVAAAGIGDVATLDDPAAVRRSLVRARRALDTLGPAGEGARRYEDLGGGLDALWDPAAADAWARDLLAPLAAERIDLVGTLRAWLARHGQVDAAAGDLGVHRHTVRHRLRRAEGLLGRSLDDAAVRAELYLALARQPDGDLRVSEPPGERERRPSDPA